jgi:EmrB/QacA subfamily drug resistance transporter
MCGAPPVPTLTCLGDVNVGSARDPRGRTTFTAGVPRPLRREAETMFRFLIRSATPHRSHPEVLVTTAPTSGHRDELVEPPPSGDTNRWLVLVIVCLAQFMVVLDATVVNVALPSIQDDLGFSAANLQWVINGYTLTFGGFLLLGGRAGDLFGRRRLFLLGVALFSGASLLCGLATSEGWLVVARGLQGLGGALIAPTALSIITTTFAEGADRTKALGVWSAIAASGGAFGLLLGGILTDLLSWEWVFFVNVPVGIATALLAFRYVPESKAGLKSSSLDLPGAVSVTAGLIVLVYAIVKAESNGWGSATTLILGAVSLALLTAFVFIERSHPAPLIRLGIFRVRSLAGANGVMLLAAGGLFAFFFFSTLYVQLILGYSPLEAGLAFLPVTVGIGLGAGLAGQLVKRIGVRVTAVVGMLVAAFGLYLFSRAPVDGSYLSDVLPAIIPQSIGMGLTFVPVTLIATTNVGDQDAGLASGLFNTSQQIGGALGLAILSTLAADKTAGVLGDLGRQPSPAEQASALLEGFDTAFVAAALLLIIGAVVLLATVRKGDVASIDTEAPPVPAA